MDNTQFVKNLETSRPARLLEVTERGVIHYPIPDLTVYCVRNKTRKTISLSFFRHAIRFFQNRPCRIIGACRKIFYSPINIYLLGAPLSKKVNRSPCGIS
jgi:hypothetical protein